MKSHSYKGFTCLVGGIPVVPNFGDTPIKIEMKGEGYTLQMGADGEGSTEDSLDDSAMITLAFMSTSDDNAKLTALALADGPGGAGITTLDIVDTKGTQVYHASEARMIGIPRSIEIGKKASVREWVFITDKLTAFVGGN